jgi:5-methylcytosine-specific restriction endonuclease McrA
MPRVPYLIYQEVMKRDNYSCTDCQKSFIPGSKAVLVCHHVIAKNHGGATTPENLRAMCYTCHPKYHPRIENLRKKNFRKVSEDIIGAVYERCY